MVREDVAYQNVAVIGSGSNQFGDLRFVGVADHPFDSWHGRDLFRSALGIATGYQDPSVPILAVYAADSLPHILIGGCGHSAGVQDYEIGSGTLGRGFQTLTG